MNTISKFSAPVGPKARTPCTQENSTGGGAGGGGGGVQAFHNPLKKAFDQPAHPPTHPPTHPRGRVSDTLSKSLVLCHFRSSVDFMKCLEVFYTSTKRLFPHTEQDTRGS